MEMIPVEMIPMLDDSGGDDIRGNYRIHLIPNTALVLPSL